MDWLKQFRYNIKLLIRDTISFAIFIVLIAKNKFFNDGLSGVRILVYHSIKDAPKNKDRPRMTVPPELFDKQIEHLVSSGYTVISMDELLRCMSEKAPMGNKKIVLTFDDGFEDNFDYSYDILCKYGLTATYFLAVDYIGSEEVFPWCDNNFSYSRPIAWDKLTRMVSGGMTIGSHTLTHQNLGMISDKGAGMDNEVGLSKRILEKRLNTAVRYFAYPFGCKGSYNKKTEKCLRENGYKAACINVLGINSKDDNVFELKRTRIDWNDNLLKFRMKISGAYDWIDKLD